MMFNLYAKVAIAKREIVNGVTLTPAQNKYGGNIKMARAVKEKKEKLIKKTFPNDKLGIVDSVVRISEADHKSKWNASGDVLEVKLKDGGLLKVTFPKDTTGSFVFEMDAKAKIMVDKIVEIEGQKLTESDIEKSIFKVSHSKLTGGDFMYLGSNLKVFKEIEKEIISTGIKTVGYYKSIMPNFKDVIHKYETLDGYKEPSFTGEEIETLPKEKSIDIKIGEFVIGKYYKERNLILMWMNPFKNCDLRKVTTYKENKFIGAIFTDFINALKTANIKKTDVSKFKMVSLVESFNKTAKKTLKSLQNRKKDLSKLIVNYEQALINYYGESKSVNAQVSALTVVGDDAIKDFIKEIEKAKKQPIVDNIELKDGHVNITFKPTTIKVEMDRSVDGSTKFGIKEMYLGKITAVLSGDGSLIVKSDARCIANYPHPHAQEGGQPCLGSGDGANGIKTSIGAREFSKFVYLFWMWIKRWRPEDCYVAPRVFYDDRLQQGYPVFNHVGKRIVINDPVLIKSGEQNKLKEHTNHAVNMKKFAKFVSQK